MWFPTQRELLAANVITKIVDSSNFASSGINDWQKPDIADKALLSIPLYVGLKEKDPESYALLGDRFADGLRKGNIIVAMEGEIRSVFSKPSSAKIF
jgi:hypothetical protein